MKEIVITRFGKGTCILRGNETEGVDAEFRDCGLKGFIGWGEFKKLLQARSSTPGGVSPSPTITGQTPSIG